MAACSPLIFDAVIAGQDKDYAAVMVWPSQAVMEQYVKVAGGDRERALKTFTDELAHKARAFNAGEPGSSRRLKRLLVLTEPPSIDAGEITDKGYVNQRLVIDRRADLVSRVYSDPLADGVVQL